MSIQAYHPQFSEHTHLHISDPGAAVLARTIQCIPLLSGMPFPKAVANVSSDMRHTTERNTGQKLKVRTHKDPALILALASDLNSSKSTMQDLYTQGRLLALKGDDELLKAVAKHPNTPGFLLDTLDHQKFAAELMQNPKTPAHILNKLQLGRFWREMALHANTPPLMLRRLAGWNKPELQKLLAQRRCMPEDKAIHLLCKPQSPFPECNSVILRIHDEKGIEKIISIPLDMASQMQMIKQKPLEALLNILAKYGAPAVQLEICRQKTLPKTTIRLLSMSAWDKVRIKTAKHPDLDEKSAIYLAFDDQPSIRAAAVKYGPLPDYILEHMLKDDEVIVRKELANRTILTSKMIEHLKKDKDPEVKIALTLNPCTPYSVVRSMTGDRSDRVSSAAGKVLRLKGMAGDIQMGSTFKQYLNLFSYTIEEADNDF